MWRSALLRRVYIPRPSILFVHFRSWSPLFLGGEVFLLKHCLIRCSNVAMTGLTALPRAISFSGCGFLGVYHVGVLQCFQKYGKELLDKFTKFGGASAGSLAAVVLAVCPEKLSIGKSLVCGMAAEVRKHPLGLLTPGFHLSAHVKKMMEEVLPEDAHTKATGRVFISVTQDSCKKNHIISEFASRAELIEVR